MKIDSRTNILLLLLIVICIIIGSLKSKKENFENEESTLTEDQKQLLEHVKLNHQTEILEMISDKKIKKEDVDAVIKYYNEMQKKPDEKKSDEKKSDLKKYTEIQEKSDKEKPATDKKKPDSDSKK